MPNQLRTPSSSFLNKGVELSLVDKKGNQPESVSTNNSSMGESVPPGFIENPSGLIRPEGKDEVIQREKRLIKKERYLQLKQKRDEKLQKLENDPQLNSDEKKKITVRLQTEFTTQLADVLDPHPIEGQKTPFKVVQKEAADLGLELPPEFDQTYQEIVTSAMEIVSDNGVTENTFEDKKEMILQSLREFGFTQLEGVNSMNDLYHVIEHNIPFEIVVEMYLRANDSSNQEDGVGVNDQDFGKSNSENTLQEKKSKTKELLLQLISDNTSAQDLIDNNVDFPTLMRFFLGSETGSASATPSGLESKDVDTEKNTLQALATIFANNQAEQMFWTKFLEAHDDFLGGGNNLDSKVKRIFTLNDDKDQLPNLKQNLLDSLNEGYKVVSSTNPIKNSNDLNLTDVVVNQILKEAGNFRMQKVDENYKTDTV